MIPLAFRASYIDAEFQSHISSSRPLVPKLAPQGIYNLAAQSLIEGRIYIT